MYLCTYYTEYSLLFATDATGALFSRYRLHLLCHEAWPTLYKVLHILDSITRMPTLLKQQHDSSNLRVSVLLYRNLKFKLPILERQQVLSRARWLRHVASIAKFVTYCTKTADTTDISLSTTSLFAVHTCARRPVTGDFKSSTPNLSIICGKLGCITAITNRYRDYMIQRCLLESARCL